MKKNVVVQIP